MNKESHKDDVKREAANNWGKGQLSTKMTIDGITLLVWTMFLLVIFFTNPILITRAVGVVSWIAVFIASAFDVYKPKGEKQKYTCYIICKYVGGIGIVTLFIDIVLYFLV